MGELEFNKDIKLGNEGEDVVIKDLISLGATLISKNNDNKYDFIMNFKGTQISYEVKTDVFVAPGFDTGNLFVEYECRNKPSGIKVTKADYFVTYFLFFNQIWYIKTSDLNTLIENNKFPIGIGGDPGSKSTGYLIPREKFKEHFIIRTTN